MSNLNDIMKGCTLPDGAVATEAAIVVGYLDSEGKEKFFLKTGGDSSHIHLAALLNAASHSLMHEANPCPCQEGD